MNETEVNLVQYNETISDFVSLTAEHGVAKVVATLRKEFPAVAEKVYQHMGKPAVKVAALLRA